ncbi:MAG TPA: transcription-repair coupling factor, partial [Actinomycetota bacterium]
MNGSDVSLDLLLDDMTRSEPFERLLLERARPVLGRADAGSDFVVASLARALDAPVLAVAPGPPEAEVLARGITAFLGHDRVALFPSWEALPYEGISPSPETAGRRSEAARSLRRATGPFALVAPAHAVLQGIVPT